MVVGSALVGQIASKPELTAYYGLYTVRDPTRAPTLTSVLAHAMTHPHNVIGLDLTKLDNVRQVAGETNARVSAGGIPPISALILNAGFQDFRKQSWTDDGLDTTFAANYLGHWLLTLLLLKSIDKEVDRIMVIRSQSPPTTRETHELKAFDDPKYKTFVSDAAGFEAIANGTWSPATEDASFRGGFRRCGAAKLFLIMMQHELQVWLNVDPVLGRICVLGVDPGTMTSGLQRLAPWSIRVVSFRIIYPLVLYLNPNGPVRPRSRSAGDVLEAAFGAGKDGKLLKDKYFDGSVLIATSDESMDAAKKKPSVEGNDKVGKLDGGRDNSSQMAMEH